MRVLGSFAVDGLDERAIGSRKARLLLKLLACERGGAVSTDRIVDALWGADAPAKPADQISVLVSRMRSVLGGRIDRTDDGYTLLYDWLDLDELIERSREAVTRLAAGRTGAARAAAAAAVRLVTGRVLGDEDAPWADSLRAQIERAVAEARHAGASAALVVDAAAEALGLATDALDRDPYDEVALQLVMRAESRLGRTGAALTKYSEFRERLIDEFGIGPSPQTEQVHDDIVLGTNSAATAAASRVRGETMIVGRSIELDELDAQLAAVEAESRLVVIEGEPGIGKSALVAAWVPRAERDGADVLTCRCDQLGIGLPLQPVLDAVGAWMVHRLGVDDAAAAIRADPVLGGLLGSDVRPNGRGVEAGTTTSAEDPVAGRQRLFAALTALIDGVRGESRFVMIIEDVREADAATMAWIGQLVRTCGRVLVVITTRDRDVHPPDATIIPLGPLDVAAAAELVGDDSVGLIFERSGGNPLFLLELAQVADGQLPATIVEAVRRRSAALGPAASTVRIAALLGAIVDLDLLAACCRRPIAEVLDHIEVALGHDLLVDDERGLRFRHDVVREALVVGTTGSVRTFVHREASVLLAARTDRRPLDAAHHAELGGAEHIASDAFVEGARIAADRFETDLADELLGRAIELADSPQARIARARVRLTQRALDAAAADIEIAIEIRSSASALELAGWIAYYRRDYPTARRYAEEAGSSATVPELRASAAMLEGRIRHSQGDLVGAVDCLSAPASIDSGTTSSVGVARVWLAAALAHQGRATEAIATVESAGDPSLLRSHPFATGHAWFTRCLAAGISGQLANAFHAAERLDHHANSTGVGGVRFRPFALNLRSWLERSVGNLELAWNLSERALDAAGRASFEEPAVHARLDQVEVLLATGQLDAAESVLHVAIEHQAPSCTMAWHQQQRVMLLSGRLALLAGDVHRAGNFATELAADARGRSSRRHEVLAAHLGLLVACHSGASPTADDVATLLPALDRLAALDAWQLVAQLASASGLASLWPEAQTRANALIAQVRDVEHLDPDLVEAWITSTLNGLMR